MRRLTVSMMTAHRNTFGRLGYVLLLVASAELYFQAYYRLTVGVFLFKRANPPLYALNEFSNFWNKPNLSMEHRTNEFRTMLFTNSKGFRTSAAHEEPPLVKPEGSVRLMLLGPSFAFGWGVNHEQTFLQQLARRLDGAGFASGRRVEAINAGVPAMPPACQARWYESVGREFHPDLVIQFVYGSMAVGECAPQTVCEGRLLPATPDLAQRARSSAKNSATLFYGWILVTRIRSWLEGPKASHSIEGAGRELLERGHFDPEAADLQESLSFYGRLAEVVRRGGGRLLVVYFPLSYGVHPQDVGRWRHLGISDVGAQRSFDAAFCAFLNENGTECLDITDALVRAAAKGERLYYWLDVHWTPRGNRIAAEAVAGYLEANTRIQAAKQDQASPAARRSRESR